MMPLSTLKATRVHRVAGNDRYSTAIAISKATFGSADGVVIASGTGFADALSAAPLAGVLDGPVLLTPQAAPTSALIAELKRLGVQRIFVVGGPASVSDNVIKSIRNSGLPTPVRISGKNRYQTSARVASQVINMTGKHLEPYIVRGDVFPDALTIAPFAYQEQRPVLLTAPTYLPNDVVGAWKAIAAADGGKAIIIGGKSSVSDAVLNSLAYNSPGYLLSYARISGTDRYQLSEAVVKAWGTPMDVLGVASGDVYADALAGSAALGHMGGAILLNPATRLCPSTSRVLAANGIYAIDVPVYGGAATISSTVMTAARSSLGGEVLDFDLPSGVVSMSRRSSAGARVSGSSRHLDFEALGPQKMQFRP